MHRSIDDCEFPVTASAYWNSMPSASRELCDVTSGFSAAAEDSAISSMPGRTRCHRIVTTKATHVWLHFLLVCLATRSCLLMILVVTLLVMSCQFHVNKTVASCSMLNVAIRRLRSIHRHVGREVLLIVSFAPLLPRGQTIVTPCLLAHLHQHCLILRAQNTAARLVYLVSNDPIT